MPSECTCYINMYCTCSLPDAYMHVHMTCVCGSMYILLCIVYYTVFFLPGKKQGEAVRGRARGCLGQGQQWSGVLH